MKSSIAINLVVSVLFLAACSRREPAGPAGPQEASSESRSNVIEIGPTVRNNLGITFAAVERREVADTLRVPGAFELQPLARHEYRIALAGKVRLEVDQFQQVEPGDVLFRFHSPEWIDLKKGILIAEQQIQEAKGNVEVARAKLEEAKNQLLHVQDRLNALASAEFSSADLRTEAQKLEWSLPRLRAELNVADTQRASAEALHEHALHRAASLTGLREKDLIRTVEHEGGIIRAYRTIDWIDVHAIEHGVVESLAVTDGSFVEPPALIVTTVDPGKVRFRATALQSDMPHIEAGSTGRIVPPRSKGTPIHEAIEAPVFLGLEAHPDQRTVTVIATPQSRPSWVHPGVSAFLEIVLDSTEGPALAIPTSAVVKDGIGHVFFRRNPSNPNQAIRVEADLGIDDGRWVVVHSGVSLGDDVVLDGAYELKLATTQSGASQQGGHFHADGSFHGEH